MENDEINNNNPSLLHRHEASSSSLLNYNVNQKNNKKVNKLEVNNENEYDNNQINDVDTNDKEFNFNVDNNNPHNEEDNSYNQSKLKTFQSSNDMMLSLLKINKADKKEKRGVSNVLNDMAISLAKPDELPQIYNIMVHNSDKNIKPI